MFYYLHELHGFISWFRVFQYITVRVVAGAGTAFIVSLVAGPWVISRLARLCKGDESRYKGVSQGLDDLYGDKKRTTPSMGGLLIIGSVVISCLLWAAPANPLVWLVVATFCFMGAIGFADDYVKKVMRNPKGLSGRIKLLFEFTWAFVIMLLLDVLPQTRETSRHLMLPFFKNPVIVNMCFVCALVFVSAVLVGASNAVNLADGLDGLAIGCVSSVFFAMLVMVYVAGHARFAQYLQVPFIPGSGELAVFCGCVLGASLGFLWFNCHPATVFMGDTGSLALGGSLGMIAVLVKHEVALAIIGGIFVMEAMSVILQVSWFKLKGRRIFACAPIHHHFQMKKNGWSETQVTIRFWIISIIFALFGILMLKIR